ncbi:hypothetical protein N9059_00160, partial [bacterium]|nr:hypothetical protein [bacterium]
RMTQVMERIWKRISDQVQEAVINGPQPGVGRSGNSLSISFPGLDGEAIALRADLKGLCIHAGSACVNRSNRIPSSMKAIGADEERARGVVLLSPGLGIADSEVDQGVAILVQVVRDLYEISL